LEINMDHTNLVWTTDTHLNFISEIQIKSFCNKLVNASPSLIVITGDISEAPTLETHLRMMEMYIPNIPIYFVCGNHDYYKGSITVTRDMLKEKFGANSRIQWLPNIDYVPLTKRTALVGHDGWYDGRYANYFDSRLDMQDYHIIKELQGGVWYNEERYQKIGQLAIEGALHITGGIRKAFDAGHDLVYVATHVAPFKENSRAPDGKMSDMHWMPHFSSKILGDALMTLMREEKYEHKKITVLCGHNHTAWVHEPRENIVCYTGGAEYRYPNVTDAFQIF